MMSDPLRAVLEDWDLAGADVTPIAQGLINQSFLVDAGERYVLQRLNAIFDPAIHHNIEAVSERVAAAGLDTPRLVRTRRDALWTTHDDHAWRLLTFVAGQTHDHIDAPAAAYSAGAFLGRWHAALAGMTHEFVAMRLGVHDTSRHLERLRHAVRDHAEHRLHPEVAPLAADITTAAKQLPPLAEREPIIGHGDPKISNVVFEGDDAVALIDLDTVGPTSLAHELGDAWRSWCNPEREDAAAVRFELPIFEGSWQGYAAAHPVDAATRAALLHGVEWISLELAARFADDALRESYFGWDAARFESRGHHNLARARGQWALYQAVIRTRPQRARALALR